MARAPDSKDNRRHAGAKLVGSALAPGFRLAKPQNANGLQAWIIEMFELRRHRGGQCTGKMAATRAATGLHGTLSMSMNSHRIFEAR